jgi:hypothetical protein
MVVNDSNLVPKSSKIFSCQICDYNTSRKSQFDRHLATDKHKKTENGSKMIVNDSDLVPKSSKIFTCSCGKIYKYDSGYYRHKKTCNNTSYLSNSTNSNNNNSSNQQYQTMIDLIKDNKEIKDFLYEQNKQLIELVKTAGSYNTTNSHNKFNINMFLNEKCKDALNISDFISQLKIGINDLEETGRLGFADGISKIFINGLNQLEFCNRPIHCNDAKREVLYIKDSDKWTKEDDDKPILTKAIKEVAYRNMKQITEWQKLHCDFNDPESKQNDKYLQIVSESMSGCSKEESEKNYNKIIKKLAKETIIPEIVK